MTTDGGLPDTGGAMLHDVRGSVLDENSRWLEEWRDSRVTVIRQQSRSEPLWWVLARIVLLGLGSWAIFCLAIYLVIRMAEAL